MTITYPSDHRQYFDTIKAQLYSAPLTIAELCYLQDSIKDRLRVEREECYLFSIGDRERELIRQQFSILCQALELDSVGVLRLRPERDNGELKWTLYDRCLQVYAVLVLRGTDDTWEIRPLPISDRKRATMTPKEKKDTAELEAFSLKMALETQKVNLSELGGWKLAC